jgi:hypothetical protein
VRHREIVRQFDLRSQVRLVGDCPIPQQQVLKASGDVIYSAEVNEMLHPEAPPDSVPMDVWARTVELVRSERQSKDGVGNEPYNSSRATLQVIELVRIPYTRVQYRYSDQDYLLYIYDSEGKEKFYAERYPARWDRIDRLVKAISADLMAPVQKEPSPPSPPPNPGVYRVHIEVPPQDENEEEKP